MKVFFIRSNHQLCCVQERARVPACMRVCMCVHVRVCVCFRGWCWLSSSVAQHLTFLRCDLWPKLELTKPVCLPSQLAQKFTCLCFPLLGIIDYSHHSIFIRNLETSKLRSWLHGIPIILWAIFLDQYIIIFRNNVVLPRTQVMFKEYHE